MIMDRLEENEKGKLAMLKLKDLRYDVNDYTVSEILKRIELIKADVTETAVTDSCFAVLSNPPYVTSEAYRTLMPEIYFEPEIAFVGGEDGLRFYRRITELYRSVIADEGFIAFEIGYDQADALTLIAENNEMTIEIIKDLSGNDRVAVLKKK